MKGFFAFITRMKYINRWGLMHNTRYESLFEHSFETAYIANALANIENTMFGGDFDAELIATQAMFHDCAEIITGDMPTPVKYKDKTIESAYGKAEASAWEKLLESLPSELKPTYRGYIEDDRYHGIIKAADKLSALIKCLEEKQVGNRDFESAENAIRKWLSDCPYKSVGYFIDNLLPAYSLTLDELTRSE